MVMVPVYNSQLQID